MSERPHWVPDWVVPDWVVPGASVAVITGARSSVSFDTIAKVVPGSTEKLGNIRPNRDVVLDSGRRFTERRGNFYELSRDGYYLTSRLALPDDEIVLGIQRRLNHDAQ